VKIIGDDSFLQFGSSTSGAVMATLGRDARILCPVRGDCCTRDRKTVRVIVSVRDLRIAPTG
jgi:hypothetical protein